MEEPKENKKEKDPTTGLFIISALIPLIGILGGLYYLIKGEGSRGVGMILVGIVFSFIYSILLGII